MELRWRAERTVPHMKRRDVGCLCAPRCGAKTTCQHFVFLGFNHAVWLPAGTVEYGVALITACKAVCVSVPRGACYQRGFSALHPC